MKKKNILPLIVILMIFTGPDFAFGRQILQDKVNEIKDKVILITDRSIYIAGEQVNFSATLFAGNNADPQRQSKILYCELITPDGNKVSGDKFMISNSLASGCLPVREDLLTGTYYLRAYTKHMRVNGPASFGYKQIRIVNPRRDELLAGDNNENSSGGLFIQVPQNQESDMLSVSIERNIYASRDSVKLSIRPANVPAGNIKSLSLSVAPETTTSIPMQLQMPKENRQGEAIYYPEARGLSLTGKLTEGSSLIPVKGTRINLSIIGKGRDFMAVRTDSLGRFIFSLPDYTGSRDIFLGAEKTSLSNLKIWVDNDFCTLPFNLPSPAFVLSEQERKAVYNMALNMQIDSHFFVDTLAELEIPKKENLAFYGEPTSVLFLDQYVQLPTLEEYFNELPGQVKVRKRMGDKYFKVSGSHGLSFYDPLVLVDWVAVDEPDKILAVSPQNISRIEIVNEDYVKGGQTYGGIISIISKKGDFAGIDLPSTGIFIHYRFLTETQCNYKAFDYGAMHPDVHNTILWKPGIMLKQGKPESFVFSAPDTPGKYNVVIEGVTLNGELFSTTNVFEVKN